MITFIYGILAGIGSAISFGSFGEPHMDIFWCLRSLCELKLCQRQPESQTLSLALLSRRANQMQTDYGCQGGLSCFQGLSFCLTSSLTASIAKAGPDRHALTCAGASLCVPDLQELGLLPDQLHCAGVELAGQVHLVGDGERLSQSCPASAQLPPLPCFMQPWPLSCTWLHRDVPLSALQVGAAIWVSHALRAIACPICTAKGGCRAVVQHLHRLRPALPLSSWWRCLNPFWCHAAGLEWCLCHYGYPEGVHPKSSLLSPEQCVQSKAKAHHL